MLVPVLMFSTGFMITARIPPDSTVEIPMIGPTWDSATNEVIIARQGPDINFDYDINFYISVALDGIEVIRGKQCWESLTNCWAKWRASSCLSKRRLSASAFSGDISSL